MLNFYEQYNIAHGIFITYSQRLDKRLLHSKHSKKIMEKHKQTFPYKKYETYTKENFVLVCIHIMLEQTPSSFISMIGELRNYQKTQIKKFKSEIVNYRNYLKQDIAYLKNSGNVSYKVVLREFSKGKIKFYTAWFYILFHEEKNKILEEIASSRVTNFIYQKIKFVMLFISFNQEYIETQIKQMYNSLEV